MLLSTIFTEYFSQDLLMPHLEEKRTVGGEILTLLWPLPKALFRIRSGLISQ